MCSRSDGQLRATNCLALFHRVCLCIQENPPSRRTSVAPQPTVQPHEIEPPAGCATARTLVLTVAGRRRWRSGAARRRAGERQLLAGRLTVARRECPRGAGVRSGPFGPTAYTSLPWITRAADAIGSALSHGLSPPPAAATVRASISTVNYHSRGCSKWRTGPAWLLHPTVRSVGHGLGAGRWEVVKGLACLPRWRRRPQRLGRAGSSVIRPRVRARETRARACGGA